MSPKNWQQIEEAYHAALELDPEGRAAYLTNAFAKDNASREEVESLLQQDPSSPVHLLNQSPIGTRSNTLAAGVRLGPYIVEEPLGAGGMGEVWKARDIRLHREVAIKLVVTENPGGDGVGNARLWQEARAAAQVSHPNLCQLFDVIDDGCRIYLVMELLQGRPLSARIAEGPMAPNEASAVISAVLTALGALHDNRLVHCDLKPSNVFLTPASVKVLDFGLAVEQKLNDPSKMRGGTQTIESPNAIAGTPPYMAPERINGAPPAPSADLFAAGCLLYEMLSGRRAFGGDTATEVFQNVMLGGPLPTELAPDSRRFWPVIERAIAKRPEDRFGSAAEMREAVTSAGNTPKRPLAKVLIAIGSAVAAVVGAGVWWRSSGHDFIPPYPYPLQVTRVSKLTSYPGDEREPAISPDGSSVAFSWSGPEGDNYDIYVVQSGGQQPLRLTRDPAPDSFPAWSPDGHQIAFVRHSGIEAEIIVVSALGGTERVLHHFFRMGADLDFSQHPVLNYSHDGKSIIYSGQSVAGQKYRLFLLSLDNGDVRAVSSPEKELLGDSSPALSVDATSLAFVRYLAPRNGRLLIQRLGPRMIPMGEPIDVKTSGLAVRSPIWLEDGKQLLFADASRIFQWKPGAEAVPIYAADGYLGGMSVGPKRRGGGQQIVIASEKSDADIWAIPLNAGGAKSIGPARLLQRSTAWDSHPDFSPDGRRIVFVSNRSGTPEVWVSDADGSNPRQLTNLGAHVLSYPKWSPDGTRISFHARVPDVAQVYTVDPRQGLPKQITHENPGLALATWSNDGRFIYASTLVGGIAVTHRFPSEGGPKRRLWEGGWARESVDGKFIMYFKTNGPGIFRRSLNGDVAKNPEELLVPGFLA